MRLIGRPARHIPCRIPKCGGKRRPCQWFFENWNQILDSVVSARLACRSACGSGNKYPSSHVVVSENAGVPHAESFPRSGRRGRCTLARPRQVKAGILGVCVQSESRAGEGEGKPFQAIRRRVRRDSRAISLFVTAQWLFPTCIPLFRLGNPPKSVWGVTSRRVV